MEQNGDDDICRRRNNYRRHGKRRRGDPFTGRQCTFLVSLAFSAYYVRLETAAAHTAEERM